MLISLLLGQCNSEVVEAEDVFEGGCLATEQGTLPDGLATHLLVLFLEESAMVLPQEQTHDGHKGQETTHFR